MFELAIFIAGTIAGVAAFVTLITSLSSRGMSEAETGPSDSEKLAIARSRFGLIANRQSIGEARKIANKALKETQ